MFKIKMGIKFGLRIIVPVAQRTVPKRAATTTAKTIASVNAMSTQANYEHEAWGVGDTEQQRRFFYGLHVSEPY